MPSAAPSKFGLALLALLAVLTVPGRARAQNPFDARQRDRAQEAARAGRSASGILPLLELWQDFGRATPAVTLGELERLSGDRRLPPARRAYVGALHAQGLRRTGELARSRDLLRNLGFITDFRVVGPFDNEGKVGFLTELPPEAARLAVWDPDVAYEGRERLISWRAYPSEAADTGYVSFDAVMRPQENACAFAETYVRSERSRPLTLWVGNGGATTVYWNGEVVLTEPTYAGPDPDRHVTAVLARRGFNRVLVKVCAVEGTWGFYLRIGDEQGAPAPGLLFDASEHHPVSDDTPRARPPRRPQSVLARLEARADGAQAPAQALEDLARFLALTDADDPNERRAKDLAERAASKSPTARRLRLAASLAEERGEIMRFSEQASRLASDDREVRLLAARVRSSGLEPEAALPLVDALMTGDDTVALEARILKTYVLRRLELLHYAARVMEEVAARAPGAPAFLRARVQIEEDVGHLDRAMELRRELVAARYDDKTSRQALLLDALRRNDRALATAQIQTLEALLPGDVANLMFLSRMHAAMGQSDQAHALLVRGRRIAPEDATLLASLGKFLLRMGQEDAAIEALREALALRPQDADTRELLEQIQPRQRQDEAYAVSRAELLSRRVERSGFPTTVLEQLTVNTVFENGLGSSFHQFAAQAHNDEGARQLRTYSIQYDPASQRVDVRQARVLRADGHVLEATQRFEHQLGEPWFRTYYDTRAMVLVFSNLEPGDSVEVQYRVDDVAHRNLFADYFGDLHFLKGFAPIRGLDYVLITPRSRPFFFNRPALPELTHDVTVRGERRIHHFHASDLGAIRSEDGMPGLTEVSPYLHVSTYRTWDEVGRWWWGLIQDQLQADEGLKRVVRDLVRDAPDLRTKVTRIHDWVIRNTRYVALEFGIHGYKPYRMPLVVQRGFGDCKDKASLMYTMFREAGIDARIALVRTRRNGAIRDLPASLAVFDHAIAYVPELDLFLDGTAEHSGTSELPTMDQGVTVLIVGPNESRLTRTPILDPGGNRRVRVMDAHLRADGSARIDVTETIVGTEAPRYRSEYGPEGTRAERFERSLRQIFPGLVLDSQTMLHLQDLESEVQVEYRAEVPQFAHRDGRQLRVAPSVLEDLLRDLARSVRRHHPLDLGGTRSYEEERILRLPQGHRPLELPPGGVAESEFGMVSIGVESDGDVVRVRTRFELRRDRIARSQYVAFRRWVEEADELLRQRIAIGREET